MTDKLNGPNELRNLALQLDARYSELLYKLAKLWQSDIAANVALLNTIINKEKEFIDAFDIIGNVLQSVIPDDVIECVQKRGYAECACGKDEEHCMYCLYPKKWHDLATKTIQMGN